MRMLLSTVAVVAAIASIAVADDRESSRPSGEANQPPAKPQFKDVDSNRDGKISQAELSKARGGDVGTVDTDGDGTLDRGEYQSMTWPTAPPEAESPPDRGTRSAPDPAHPRASQGSMNPD